MEPEPASLRPVKKETPAPSLVSKFRDHHALCLLWGELLAEYRT